MNTSTVVLFIVLVFSTSFVITEEPQPSNYSLPSPSVPPSPPVSPSPSKVIQSIQAPSSTCNVTTYRTPSPTAVPSLTTCQASQTKLGTQISPRSNSKPIARLSVNPYSYRRKQLMKRHISRRPLSSIGYQTTNSKTLASQYRQLILAKVQKKTPYPLQSLSHVEITVWTHVASITSAIAIRKVSDFVKSITDVSNTFTTTSSASVRSSPSAAPRKQSENVCSVRQPSSSYTSNTINNTVRCNQRSRKKRSEQSSPTPHIPSPQLFMDDKEKPFNFASADAGARVMLASDGTIGAKNVLDDNVDKYLLTPCQSGGPDHIRWIDIELSEEAILERFQTANLEYYSSSPRKIVVLSANSYPPTQWNLLGMFEFANVKTHQTFPIEKRVVTRYMRVMFAGRHGHEYYCPISSVRAFGKNLIADWKDALESDANKPHMSEQSVNTARSHRSKSVKARSGRSHSEIQISQPHFTSLNSYVESIVGDYSRLAPITSIESAYDFPYSERCDNVHIDENDMGDSSDEDQVRSTASDKVESDEENVFRKVTRMLRTLELNQTLTSQYLDSQLNKFSKQIQAVDEKVVRLTNSESERLTLLETQLLALMIRLEELERQNWLRDLFLGVLLLAVMIIAGLLLNILVSADQTRHVSSEPLLDNSMEMGDCPSPSPPRETGSSITRSLSSTDLSQQLYF